MLIENAELIAWTTGNFGEIINSMSRPEAMRLYLTVKNKPLHLEPMEIRAVVEVGVAPGAKFCWWQLAAVLSDGLAPHAHDFLPILVLAA